MSDSALQPYIAYSAATAGLIAVDDDEGEALERASDQQITTKKAHILVEASQAPAVGRLTGNVAASPKWTGASYPMHTVIGEGYPSDAVSVILPHQDVTAFVVLDEQRTFAGQVQLLIQAFRRGSRLRYAARLVDRLNVLAAEADEEEAFNEESPQSLRRMLQFLTSFPSFAYPTVTVTPAGTFRAQWTKAQAAHLGLEFLGSGQLRFVVFCPDPRNSGRVQRLGGIADWHQIMRILAPFNVFRWAGDGGR